MARNIGIIGTGDYGTALQTRLSLNGYNVQLGSRKPKQRSSAVSIAECIKNGDLIICAMHADNHSELKQYSSALAGKTVVDVSNPTEINQGPSNAKLLADLLPKSNIVKAFNTVSAYTMGNITTSGESKVVYICGDDQGAKNEVIELSRSIGFNAVDSGSLTQAKQLENLPLQLFTDWQAPTKVTFYMFMIWLIYGNARYLYLKKDPYTPDRIMSNITNKAFACTALTLLAITYMPGCIAAIAQMINGTKHKRFPDWLDCWLKMRKQLGVYALLFGGVHMMISVTLMSPAYFKPWYMFDKIKLTDGSVAIASRMNSLGESVLLFGVMAVLLMVILGLTSVPAIGDLLNWREWTVVHSYLGYLCLLMATLHVTVVAFPDWIGEPAYKAVQRLTFLSSVLPWIVLITKLILCFPPINSYVQKIRRGWEREGVSNDKKKE